MIRILFFIPGLSEGGAEKVMRSLVNHMDQEQFEITVQTIDQYDPSQFLAKGIRYKAINRCKTRWGRKLFSYWFRLCAELNLAYRFFVKDDYDIEVAYLETAATKVIAQSTNKDAVKIVWVHCDLSKKEGIQEARDKIRSQYEKFDRIVCVSEDVRAGFHKVFGPEFDTTAMKNVIDDAEILEKSKEPIEWNGRTGVVQLMAVGRLSPEKGYLHLIRSCKKLKNNNARFHLTILGEGPERERLMRYIDESGLKEHVTLQGAVANPYSWMKRADVIICSSQYEGLSTVVQEAIILGKPVITTPCGGMKDLLGESEYGLIVESDEDGLYRGLYKIINCEDLRLAYAGKAQARRSVFSKSAVINSTQGLFVSLLHQKCEGRKT